MPTKSFQTTAALIALMGTGASLIVIWSLWKNTRKKQQKCNLYMKKKRVTVVDTSKQWEDVYPYLLQEIAQIKVLGLDCEWVQNRPVALLQIATPNGYCVLVRLFKIGLPLPPSLVKLLGDKSVMKVGVAVNDDGKKLLLDFGCRVSGCVDLRFVLKRVRGAFNCPSKGLRGLAKGVLNLDINKDSSIRCGNWEADEYSQQQKDYAAADAAVAVDIFLRLVHTKTLMPETLSQSRLSSDPSISQSVHPTVLPTEENSQSENSLPKNSPQEINRHFSLNSNSNNDTLSVTLKSSSALNESTSQNTQPSCITQKQSDTAVKSLPDVDSNGISQTVSKGCDSIRNDIFSNIHVISDPDDFWKTARSMCQGLVDVPFSSNLKGGGMPVTKSKQKVGKDGATSAYSFRSRKLWDNCRLLAPDDTPLCTCDMRKAKWYLYKELADKVCDDPLTVRLRFEPSGRPNTEKNYYLQEKENVCVVCGHDQDYVRKFVIPYEYRKFFPNSLKDHSSHDVLLLCTPCHRRSCDLDSFLRLQLAQECEAPLESGTMSKTVLDRDLQQIRSAGRALKSNKASIPEERVTELEKILLDFFGVESLTDELLDQACSTDARQISEDYVPHGKLVVRHMAKNGGLLAFMTRWRQHFVDSMDPQFLPNFWSVDFVPDGWKRQM